MTCLQRLLWYPKARIRGEECPVLPALRMETPCNTPWLAVRTPEVLTNGGQGRIMYLAAVLINQI